MPTLVASQCKANQAHSTYQKIGPNLFQQRYQVMSCYGKLTCALSQKVTLSKVQSQTTVIVTAHFLRKDSGEDLVRPLNYWFEQ